MASARSATTADRTGLAEARLEKGIKEASFKNIDIKAEVARIQGKGGGATSNLGQWMRTAPRPSS